MMTQIVADAEMEKRLEEAGGPIEVVNDRGTVLGVFTPMKFSYSPFTREEIVRRRAEARKSPEKGKSLAEVMEHLRQLGGS
jgi:hypothetical protein